MLTVGNMYPPHHLGGYELMWRSSVEHLRAHGHEVTVLTTDHRNAAPDPAIDEGPDVHRELEWYWRDHAFPDRRRGQRLALERHNQRVLARHLEHRGGAQCVCWWAMGGMSMALLETARRRRIPAVGVVVDDWLTYGPEVDAFHRAARRLGPLAGLAETVWQVPARLELEGAARWLFVSETTRRRAVAAGLRVERSPVAHGGIENELFAAFEPGPWSARLLYVGRIDPRKGVLNAVRAVAQLPEATLVIAGHGDEVHRRELEGEIARMGIGDRVAFQRPRRDRLAQVYAAADAVIFPSLWEEPWGLVPLEAMAVGRPIVATGVGGSGEYMRDGENCLLFSPSDDPAALAAAVRRLGDDDALRRHLRVHGARTAAKFSGAAFNARVEAELVAAVEDGTG